MYPASDWSVWCSGPSWIIARAFSLTDRPQRAIWVTSVRTRSENRTSISPHPLADLGWLLIGLRHRLLLISRSSFVRAKGRSFVPAHRTSIASRAGAWKGTRTTVERALRLIADGALDDGSVETLADRLGIGSRHLSRLFQMHLGASPVQLAQTTRVQRAKRFLDETDLTMWEIAVRAGFGSLRRFNTVFAEVYRRPPTQIRRARKPSAT